MKCLTPAIVITITVMCSLQAMTADEWPVMRYGLWSFQQTLLVGGKTEGTRKELQQCTNPAEDMRKKWLSLAAHGCEFSPLTHRGQLYSYSSTCSKDGLPIGTKSMVIVMSDSDYRVMSESQNGTQVSQVRIVAHRLGACSK